MSIIKKLTDKEIEERIAAAMQPVMAPNPQINDILMQHLNQTEVPETPNNG